LDADGFLVTQQGHRVQGAYGASTVVEYDSSNGEISVQSVNDNIKLSALSMTSNDPVIPVTSTANLAIGMVVTGPGIPYGAKIIDKDDSALTITLSSAPSVTTGDPLGSQGAITVEAGSLFADIAMADLSTFSPGFPVVADSIPVGTRVVSVNGVSTATYPLPLTTAASSFASAPTKGVGFITLANTADAANLRVGMKVAASGGPGPSQTYRITKIVGTVVTFDQDLTDSHTTFSFTPTITLSDSATASGTISTGNLKYIADKNKSFANLSFGDKYKPALLVGDVRISFDEGADKDYTFVDQNGAALSGLNLANARSKVPQLRSFNVGTSGEISVILSNGQTFNGGYVLLQSFKDPGALIREGSNMFSGLDTAGRFNGEFDSSNIQRLIPGMAGLGVINGGSLELSNVDLGEEFSNMIITQRAFQAGSRIISTTDSMMEEVVNLKR